MKEIDAAWAAGFFEGEGCVRLASRNTNLTRGGSRSYGSLYVDVCQVNREPLDRLQKIAGGRVHGPYQFTSNRQPHFKWVIQQKDLVETFYKAIKPNLSQRRVEQFEKALSAFYELRNRPKLKTGPKPREAK